MYLQQTDNTLVLNPQLFCQQIDKKRYPLVKWTANMFFIGVAIKIACFSVQFQCPCANLMICSLLLEILKRCSYLKNVALDFVLLVSKLYPIQVVISLRFWIKLTKGQLLPLFLCNFCSFVSYVGGVLVTNLFALLLIDICWLFRKL